MKIKKRNFVVVAVLIMVMVFSGSAFAKAKTKTNDPYTDVTKKKVGSNSYTAITYIKAHNGYKGVISGKKFQPTKKITKGEFIKVCQNLWNKDNVPVSKDETKSKTKKAQVTAKWACNKLTSIYKKVVGGNLEWSSVPNTKLNRADASRYIKILANFGGVLNPIS